MTGEATISASQAALKVLYPDGGMPKSINEMFQFLKRLKKDEGFVGELAYVPIQNANPQGSGKSVSNAQTSLYQGNYVRFSLTRVKHYGIARISGEALNAAVKDEGALVNLWDNETKGVAVTEMSCLATYAYGIGSGALALMSSGNSGATVTLDTSANMNYFELNMLCGAISSDSLTGTVRALVSGGARVTSIDRRARTLSIASGVWTDFITALANTDYLCRAGDTPAVSGTADVITGLRSWVVGGTSPGTIFSLSRNTDPVRLAGQAIDYAGWAMEDAIVDASAQGGFQGVGYADTLVCNNLQFADMKKSLGSKIAYNRNGEGSTKGSHSFSSLVVEGENGPIEILADPFCPKNKAFLLKLDQFDLFSLKKAPHLQEYDGLKFLRKSDDDVFEVRFAFYGNMRCKNPGPQVQLTSFGS